MVSAFTLHSVSENAYGDESITATTTSERTLARFISENAAWRVERIQAKGARKRPIILFFTTDLIDRARQTREAIRQKSGAPWGSGLGKPRPCAGSRTHPNIETDKRP